MEGLDTGPRDVHATLYASFHFILPMALGRSAITTLILQVIKMTFKEGKSFVQGP